MSKICFSHRSTRIPYVTSITEKLHANGIDCFHQQDIKLSGPHWQSQWLQAAEQSDLIVCVLCRDYLLSGPCCEEFAVAQGEGKAVVVFLDEFDALKAVPTTDNNGSCKMYVKSGKQGLKPDVDVVMHELLSRLGKVPAKARAKQAALPAPACYVAKPGELRNSEGNVVRLGSDNEFPGHIGSDKFYCGWRKNIPGTDGQCGPAAGNQCASCKEFTAKYADVVLRNGNKARVRLGNNFDFPGHKGSDKFYCGVKEKIAGTDGQCGPSAGKPCAACAKFTAEWAPHLCYISEV